MYQLPELPTLPNLNHGFSTNDAGNMSFKWGEEKEVATNRHKFLDKLKLEAKNGVTAKLGQGDKIIRVGKKETNKGMSKNDYQLQADGLITNEPGIFLMHVVADCLSLLLYDQEHQAIGLGHLGRTGTSALLSKRMVDMMVNEFSTQPEKLIVGIGPGIHQCCYTFNQIPPDLNSSWQPFLNQGKDQRLSINLVGYNLYQLSEAGVEQENIFISEYCTAHSGKFFSHYRDIQEKKPEARFATIIGLK
ncbi:MAG: polyphenol oxidase family protein [Patescibacteria group bacterium]